MDDGVGRRRCGLRCGLRDGSGRRRFRNECRGGCTGRGYRLNAQLRVSTEARDWKVEDEG